MRRWKRPQLQARSISIYFAMLCDLVLLVAIVSSGWSAAPLGALCVVMLLLLWRHARCGIYVSGSGVRVIRFFGNVVVPWDQLACVEVGSDDVVRAGAHPTISGHPQMLLRTTSGTVIPTEVYRGITRRRTDFWLRPSTFDRFVAKLRERHKQEQQDR